MRDCCLHLLLKVISGENLFLQWQTRRNCCFKHVIRENLNELPLQSACWTVNALLFSSKTSLATLQWTSFVTKDNKCWVMHTWVLWWLAASELSVLNHLRGNVTITIWCLWEFELAISFHPLVLEALVLYMSHVSAHTLVLFTLT